LLIEPSIFSKDGVNKQIVRILVRLYQLMNLVKVDALLNLLNHLLLKVIKTHNLTNAAEKLIPIPWQSSTIALVPHLADTRIDFSNQSVNHVSG
jgi:hypothetical protein